MNRNEIKEEYKWNIADIFDSDDAFYNELKIAGTTLDFSEFKGKLISIDAILKCFNKMYDRGAVIEKLSVYAMMRKDENGLNPEAAKMCDLRLFDLYLVLYALNLGSACRDIGYSVRKTRAG